MLKYMFLLLVGTAFVFVLSATITYCYLWVRYGRKQQVYVEDSNNECDEYRLTEEDENKIIAYALKQLKYNQKEFQVSEFNFLGRKNVLIEREWQWYAFLDDLSVIIYVDGVPRCECESEQTLLKLCVDKFLEGEDCNPFDRIKIELHTGDEPICVCDWETKEKFIDILYDAYFNMPFHKVVSEIQKEKEMLNNFRKERKKEIYEKIGIEKNDNNPVR